MFAELDHTHVLAMEMNRLFVCLLMFGLLTNVAGSSCTKNKILNGAKYGASGYGAGWLGWLGFGPAGVAKGLNYLKNEPKTALVFQNINA